ncbi:hypothetical protein EI42_00540 [Thermosporothrix hazakensis]|jgi:hypothetical protein|uniref:Uncharacterized protein n=2 Tax=Thermosporothrix TaxID=768650 RepID=A0A326UDK5_THEHA|nr:hypothetical protein [Thermosporothrix hazakensis]PZW36366.1 hypothetical protein EI42_00540 [Thermosporothrix hazakensis]BBH88831.1 hypothetical protein KTC_35820 [Thermosporothrix sp. COM3]GCE47015.1 hypothetical protein KTH_18840 [Thermosporothrix hazakensis]
MADRTIALHRCPACQGEQVYVEFEIEANYMGKVRVKLPNRGIRDALSGRHIADIYTTACMQCGKVNFYVRSLADLLE